MMKMIKILNAETRELNERIEMLRAKLHKTAEERGFILTSDEVQRASQELDELIVEFTRLNLLKTVNR
ncbi:MAG: aspartyl-phosphate phosphatase Spo0E family protein [Firmicutes bacterium]|nr:aspartyl-phosphate phosphatase Spo0E family protein [Bacillota bacterium]